MMSALVKGEMVIVKYESESRLLIVLSDPFLRKELPDEQCTQVLVWDGWSRKIFPLNATRSLWDIPGTSVII